MPTGLRRFHNTGDLHFITISCVRKRRIFDTAEPRDTFLKILEETRAKYRFEVHGYVVMPTHVHLLLSEPYEKSLATVMQVIKQRFSRIRIEEYVWEPRYHDFNVYSEHKIAEKIEYIHMNPVKAGLVIAPGDWMWSSYSAHAYGEKGLVEVAVIDGLLVG